MRGVAGFSSCCLGIVLILQCGCFSHASYSPASTYGFLNVRSPYTSAEGQRICINFHPNIDLPATVDLAAPLLLAWLKNQNGAPELNICNAIDRRYAKNELVPALYRTFIYNNETECHRSIDENRVMASQIDILARQNVEWTLWLLKRGLLNSYGTHDYLFSYFSNPDVRDGPPYSLFMYIDVFLREVMPAIYESNSSLPLDNQATELRFYRPRPSMPIDAGVFVITAMAVGAVLLGSLWAAYDTWAELNMSDSAKRLCDESDATPHRQPAGEERASTSQTDGIVIVIESERASAGIDQQQQPPITQPNGKRRKEKKRSEERKTAAAVELSEMHWTSHCCSALIFVFFITTLLTIAYLFRDYAIHIFNLFIYLVGILSVHKVVYSFLQIIFSKNRARGERDFDVELFRVEQVFCCGDGMMTTTPPTIDQTEDWRSSAGSRSPSSRQSTGYWTSLRRQPVKLLSLLVFCGSTVFCTTWLYMWLTDHPYAFLRLNVINFCVCIVGIRDSACRSMRLITFLMLMLFCYDLFMVFGSKLVTRDGCSIMLQVATGVSCEQVTNASTNATPIPIAPIDADVPSKIPFVFYVPYLSDPMRECYDLEVERGFHFMLLGLGDVIPPGFIVAYAFYIDTAKRHRFYSFGIITWLGYVAGMVMTFFALYIMRMGQPALIYLVPSTLLPLLLWSWWNSMLAEVWRGGDLTRSY